MKTHKLEERVTTNLIVKIEFSRDDVLEALRLLLIEKGQNILDKIQGQFPDGTSLYVQTNDGFVVDIEDSAAGTREQQDEGSSLFLGFEKTTVS